MPAGRLCCCVWLTIVSGTLAAEEPIVAIPELRAAVERSIPLLTKAAVGHRENRACFACHNQGLPVLVLTAARPRGFAIDTAELQRQLEHTFRFLEKNRDNYRAGKGQGGQVDTAGYALWTLSAGDWKPDETTQAVIEYLLARDNDQDHWVNVSTRPPSEASPITTTYVALRGLATYGTDEQQERIAQRRTPVRQWLAKTTASDHEDRVFRLLALHAVDASAEELAAARKELLDHQREDGGWAQLDKGEPESATRSDAYATGTALVALHRAGGLATDSDPYQRGLKFLLQSQQTDGSWHVVSRSKPFQSHFESGYPHAKDQFLSCAAGSWATLAMVEAIPKTP